MNDTINRTITKGFIGTGAPVVATVLAHADNVEQWSRIGMYLCAMAVSIITFISIARKMRGRP